MVGFFNCTRSRDRTGTALLPLVFETSASTNSAIRAIKQEVAIVNFQSIIKNSAC